MSNSYLDLIFVIGFSWCGREVFFFLGMEGMEGKFVIE